MHTKKLYFALSATLFFLTLLIAPVQAVQSVQLAWDAPTTNADGTPLTDLAGYKLYYGSISGIYTVVINVGNQTTYTVPDLGDGQTYYFAVTAYDTMGNESELSEELRYDTPSINIKIDTDGDGLFDEDEIKIYGTNPLVADTDGDGLSDGAEITIHSTNPLASDTDGDGLNDGVEISQGSDPTKPEEPPDPPSSSGEPWTDYRVMLTMRSTDDDALGVMFRYQDANNYYRFSWDKERAYRRLVKKENGVFTLLAGDQVPYEVGRTYQVEIVAQHSTLEVWIDGTRIFTATDTSFAAGSIALYSWFNKGSYFDEMQVEDLRTGIVLLWDDFSDGNLDGWRIVDEGRRNDPSRWSATTGTLVQSTDIYSKALDPAKLSYPGTFALYEIIK
jgi:hypothetical protein